MKLMGKREIGELDVSDLVSALLISEIAAIPIDDPDIPLLNAIIPILFILSVEILLSYAKTRSSKLKRCIEGESVFLIYKGVLDQDALRENRISLNEFLCEMRTQGIGDISLIEYAVLEQSGKISILQRGKDTLAHVLIIDGEINEAEVRDGRFDLREIDEALNGRKIERTDVLFMSKDDSGNINIIIKEEK
jgi:uncharacterized membrane protein YcaP (DUF421 family)